MLCCLIVNTVCRKQVLSIIHRLGIFIFELIAALLELRNKGEARRHNERLLAEHLAAGGEPDSAPKVDPNSVDWLTGKATRLDTGEMVQTKEGRELEQQEYDAEGTTLQVS